MTAMDQPARRSLVTANLICLASMVIWASGLPAADLIIPHMPPIALTACRALLAAAVLLPIWWLVDGATVVRNANWLRGAWVGFVTLGLASFFVIIALQLNDPVTVAIVSAVMPVIGILLECLADHRPFTRALAEALPCPSQAAWSRSMGRKANWTSGLASLPHLLRSPSTLGARVRR